MAQYIISFNDGEKPFKCETCNISFLEENTLGAHVASVHELIKPFQCETCNQSFTKKGNLVRTEYVLLNKGQLGNIEVTGGILDPLLNQNCRIGVLKH